MMMTSDCSQDAEARSLLELSRSTLYMGVDVRHPQAARCTRHALCANHWHSPRNCPNMALAKMSPYGSSGNDDSPPMTAEEEAAAMAALDAAGINGCALFLVSGSNIYHFHFKSDAFQTTSALFNAEG